MTPDIGLANWFGQRARRTPERLALRFEGRDWTYAQMQRTIEDCAARLAARGIGKGDRVAFLGHNQPMFFFAMFAAARLGAIFVPLNFRLTGPELAFMIEDCGASGADRRCAAPSGDRAAAPAPRRAQGVPARRGRCALDRGPGAGDRAGPRRRGRRRDDHVHLGHHRPAEGRDADAWQYLVEQRQRHACARCPRGRRDADASAGLSYRRAQRDDADDLSEGRTGRPASDLRSRPSARRHPGEQGHDDVRRAGDVPFHGAASRLRRDRSFVGSGPGRRRRAVSAASAQDLSRARHPDAAGLRTDRDGADGELPRL